MKVASRNPGKSRRPVEERRRSNERPRYSGAKASDANQPSIERRKRSPDHKRGDDARLRRSPPGIKRGMDERPIRRSISPRRRSMERHAPRREHRSRSRSKSPLRRRRSMERNYNPRYQDDGGAHFRDFPFENERPQRFSPLPQQRDHPMENYSNVQHGFAPEAAEVDSWGNRFDPVQADHSREWMPEDNPDYPREAWGGDKEMNSFNDTESILKFLSAEESHPCIPMFDAQNPDLTARQWLKVIDDIGNKENWSSEKKKFQMASKLSGSPKEWFLREDKLTETWNRIKHAFTKAFPSDMDFCWNIQRMLNRVKLDNESYSNYFTYKTMLLKTCNLVGRKAVSCIIGGLKNEELKTQCFDQNFATPELLYTFLVQHEQLQKISEDPDAQQKNGKFCNYPKEYGHMNRNSPQKPGNFSNHKEPNQCIDVIINGYTLQGYNDLHSHFVTIREDQALTIKLHYVKHKKTTIKGYRGEFIDALGDINVLLRVGSVVINTQIHVVPNSFQDYPVVIGESLRKHPEVTYFEDQSGVHFSHKPYHLLQNNSFSMNEKLVQKIELPEKVVPLKGRDRPNQRQNPGSNAYSTSTRFEHPANARLKFSKYR